MGMFFSWKCIISQIKKVNSIVLTLLSFCCFLTFSFVKCTGFAFFLSSKNCVGNISENRDISRYIFWETGYDYYFTFDNSSHLQLWVGYNHQICIAYVHRVLFLKRWWHHYYVVTWFHISISPNVHRLWLSTWTGVHSTLLLRFRWRHYNVFR